MPCGAGSVCLALTVLSRRTCAVVRAYCGMNYVRGHAYLSHTATTSNQNNPSLCVTPPTVLLFHGLGYPFNGACAAYSCNNGFERLSPLSLPTSHLPPLTSHLAPHAHLRACCDFCWVTPRKRCSFDSTSCSRSCPC